MEASTDTCIDWAYVGTTPVGDTLPHPLTEVMPGISWGRADEVLSPAFWKYNAIFQDERKCFRDHRIGATLLEEVAFCLLGGFGMPAELGTAAFDRLKEEGLLDGRASIADVQQRLSEPFQIFNKARRYRFPRQKAKYLAPALINISRTDLPTEATALRDYLVTLNGIGLKTASWVVRNWLGADEVAILDIHIIRAGEHFGLYSDVDNPSRNYRCMEKRYLEFCDAIGERASSLDAIIWDAMRRLGPFGRQRNYT